MTVAWAATKLHYKAARLIYHSCYITVLPTE